MSKDLSIDFSRRLDLKDPLFKYRDEFNIPKFQNEDSIYLIALHETPSNKNSN